MKKFIPLILAVLVLVLELLPFGVILRFANPEGEPFVEAYSYFSLTPFGYANFGPLLTAVLSVILLGLCLAFTVWGKFGKGVLAVGAVAFFTSVMPLLMLGIAYFNIVSFAVTLGIAGIVASTYLTVRNKK